MIRFLFLLLFLGLAVCHDAEALTAKQEKSLRAANEIGYMYSIPDFSKMAMRESSLCVNKVGDNNTRFGCMQVGIAAARDVMDYCSRTPACSWIVYKANDSRLRQRLLIDDTFNMHVAALYYKMKLKKFGGSHVRAKIAYNSGEPAAEYTKHPEKHQYVKAVKKQRFH